MSWDDAPLFERDLSEALREFNWSAAAEICNYLIRKIHAEPKPLPETTAKKYLSLLRRKRLFRLVTLLAEALISSGQRAPQIRRQYAQALIDQNMLVAPELVLQLILQDSRLDEVEEKEARGLLGRIYKQLYVKIEGEPPSLQTANGIIYRNDSPRKQVIMERALSEYLLGYRLNPRENFWHGINAVALLARAQRDGLSLKGHPTYTALAHDILIALLIRDKVEGRLEPWARATEIEALVALGSYQEAEVRALQYAADPDADAFEIASTLRQLEEVWQLNGSVPPGSMLIPICRAALLRREGGAMRISPMSVAQDIDNIAEMRKIGPASEVAPAPFPETLIRYRQALRTCRSIARIESSDGRGRGTGLLVDSEDFIPTDFPSRTGSVLLLTNAHVVSSDLFPTALSPSEVRVNFQLLDRRFEVDEIIWSSPPGRLDATLLSLKGEPPESLEPLRLANELWHRPDDSARPLLIGHPGALDSRFSLKAGADDESFSFQDTYPTAHNETSLRYRTPVRGSSSGSALFDPRDGTVIALHHSGQSGEGGREAGESATHVNEGVPIRAIQRAARSELSALQFKSARASREDLEIVDTPAHGEKTGDPADSEARFYFALEGAEARGRFVRYGSDVALIFDYARPRSDALGVIERAANLDEARRTLTPLGVMLAPVGFTFRHDRDAGFRVMNFYDGGRRSDELRFELRAAGAPVPTESTDDWPIASVAATPATGFHVIFEVGGSILYQLFLPAQLVYALPEPSEDDPAQVPITFDLDQLEEFGKRAAASRLKMEAEVREVLSNA